MADKKAIGEIKLEYPAFMADKPARAIAIGKYRVTPAQIVVMSGRVITASAAHPLGTFPKRFRRDCGTEIPHHSFIHTWRLSEGWRETVERDVAKCST